MDVCQVCETKFETRKDLAKHIEKDYKAHLARSKEFLDILKGICQDLVMKNINIKKSVNFQENVPMRWLALEIAFT